ncbi:SDR family NAD(P)-dependent oxidoreductase [Mucilaginibacter gynuensis]|uniref:SDR family NAD(P)-dependent oxidoreductase n=1 Tax=Mucilaginibacter gynuensis TaxID=1302236 RepID=A0ABP8GD79_9SPHI
MWTTENIPNLTGKVAMVTGANTGIGFETALALYKAGAHVILACRSSANAEQAVTRLQATGGTGSLETALFDLGSIDSVKQFAAQFLKTHRQLDILINNAGVMIPPASKTVDGFELQFGVNVIGHFALTGSLYPLLKATPFSRVITVSSGAYLRGSIDFDNLRSEVSYDAMREYSQSKLGNLLFSLELQRRINAAKHNVLSIAAQPGANKTDLARHMTDEEYKAAIERVGELMEPWQGALSQLYAAVDARALGGALYGPDQDNGYRGFPSQSVITANGVDEAAAIKLWELAEEVTGISFPG